MRTVFAVVFVVTVLLAGSFQAVAEDKCGICENQITRIRGDMESQIADKNNGYRGTFAEHANQGMADRLIRCADSCGNQSAAADARWIKSHLWLYGNQPQVTIVDSPLRSQSRQPSGGVVIYDPPRR